jgi:YVTN family beta-propeller protein
LDEIREIILLRSFMFTKVMLVIASITLGSAWMLRDANTKPAGSGLLVVANQKEHTVLIVDPEEQREVAKIVVGVNGHEVMTSRDGRFAYVPIYGNSGVGRPGTDGSTIDVVDLQERKLAATIDLGKPLRPHRAEWGPDGLLYVTAELANAVDVVDPTTRRVVAEIPTGQKESHMLVISSDGRRGYTANVGAGSVSVMDLAKRSLITTIPVAKVVQRISISPDGRRVFTHDQDTPRIAVIDTATYKIVDWIAVGTSVYASELTPDGRWLLALNRTDALYVIDLQSKKVIRTLKISRGASEILIRPGGDIAYISGTGAGKIDVLNLHSWELEKPIELTPGVDGLAWATNRVN